MSKSIVVKPVCLGVSGALASLALAATAQATIVAQEGFGEYPANEGFADYTYFTIYDNPGPNSGFTGFTGANEYAGDQALAGALTYPGLAPIPDATPQYLNSNAGGVEFQANIDTSAGGLFGQNGLITNSLVGTPGTTLYMSYVYQLLGPGGSNMPTSGTGTLAQNYLSLQNGSVATFTLGQSYQLTNFSVNGGGNVLSPIDNDIHLVVLELNFSSISPSDDTQTVYFDPTPGVPQADQTPFATTFTKASEFNNIDFFSQGNEIDFDDIRFGTTFADVVPSSVPEPASLALLSLSGLLALRRRRRHP